MNFYKKPANAVILTETDPLRFFTCFFSTLLHKEPEELDLLTGMVRSPQQVRQITQTHERNMKKEAQG